jgi:hypothetical protein
MIRTIARGFTIITIAALTLATTTALAQETRITGTVSSVDAATRTIRFVDGSAVRLHEGAIGAANGREVPLETLTPGSTATVVSAAPRMGDAATPTAPYPVAVSGTVARVDRQNRVITLQDGRAIQLTGQSFVWQAAPIDSIQPGAQIYVPNVQSSAVAPQRPVVVAPPSVVNPDAYVGVVRGVDRNNSLIALNDGTYIKVMPETRLQSSAGTPMSMRELRSGDQVAVWPRGRSAATETATVSRGDLPPVSAIKADYIQVTRVAS